MGHNPQSTLSKDRLWWTTLCRVIMFSCCNSDTDNFTLQVHLCLTPVCTLCVWMVTKNAEFSDLWDFTALDFSFFSHRHCAVSLFFFYSGKLVLEQSFHTKYNLMTCSNMVVNWRHLFSNQMIFAEGPLSFCCPCYRKKALKMKTEGWGGSCTDILWLLSAPMGTIRGTSALQSIASPTNRLFPYLHCKIIGAAVAGHQQDSHKSGLRQLISARRHWKMTLKQDI